jgi:hypothetical protein
MSDTVARAKEALDLGLAVIGAGSVSFIAASWKLSSEEERLERGRALLSVLLALVAGILAVVAVLFMAPVAWESVGRNRGEVSDVLLAFDLIFVLAVILLVVAMATLVRAILYIFRTLRAYRD